MPECGGILWVALPLPAPRGLRGTRPPHATMQVRLVSLIRIPQVARITNPKMGTETCTRLHAPHPQDLC